MVDHFHLNERKCHLVGLSRTAYRYHTKPNKDQALRESLKTLAAEHTRHAYLLLHGLLKAEGLVFNKKRTYRLYTEEGLQIRTKKRKKLQRPRLPMEVPSAPNQHWSMDFVSDQLYDGRRFRILNVMDDFTNEIGRSLDQVAAVRDLPSIIICDKGPEFTGKAMFFCAREKSVKLGFIQPGKSGQNAFIESLNG